MQGVFISNIIDEVGMSKDYSAAMGCHEKEVPNGIKEIPRNNLEIS